MNAKKSLFALVAMVLMMGLSSAHAYPDSVGNGGMRPRPPVNGGIQPNYPGYNNHLMQNAPEIVRRLYRGMLFREVDMYSLQYHVSRIQSRGEQGLAEVAMEIGNSGEFRQNVYYQRGSYAIVSNLYYQLLNRRGDDAGIRFWMSALDQGASGDVLKGFVTSEEFRRIWVY